MQNRTTKAGQTTLEFLATFITSMGLLIVVITVGVNYGLGYLAHYATFMASRTFLSHDTRGRNPDTVITADTTGANAVSRQTFEDYSLRSFSISSDQLKFNYPGNSNIAEFFGSYLQFERPFSYFAPMGGAVKLQYLSESFLGKEPMRSICKQRICERFFGRDGCGSDLMYHGTLYDNGC